MAKLTELLKSAWRNFAAYEAGLDELKVIRDGRAEVKELKTRYGLNDDLNSYNKWRNDDSVPKQDRSHMEFILDEIWNAGRGLVLKHSISTAEIGLLAHQASTKISQGDYAGAALYAAAILGTGELFKGIAHIMHGDEYRTRTFIDDSNRARDLIGIPRDYTWTIRK